LVLTAFEASTTLAADPDPSETASLLMVASSVAVMVPLTDMSPPMSSTTWSMAAKTSAGFSSPMLVPSSASMVWVKRSWASQPMVL